MRSVYLVTMSSLRSSLISLGLTEKEARVYLALVQLGESVVYAIADKAELKRPTTYVILNELVRKGYAKRIPRARKQLYFPVSPDEVFSLARERLRECEHALPELRALAKGAGEKKVRTTYYAGQEQVLGAFLDTLNYANGEMCGWLSDQPWRSTGGSGWWYDEYRPRRLAQNIYNRFIVPNVGSFAEYATEEGVQKEVYIEHDPSFRPKTDIMLYGDDHTLITSFEEKMGLIIESKLIHDTFLAIFERQWDALKHTNNR